MTAAFVGILVLAVFLALSPPGTPVRRIRAALSGPSARTSVGTSLGTADFRPGRGTTGVAHRWPRRAVPAVPMTLVVQQLAALLKGGRTPSRLWDELWILYAREPAAGSRTDQRLGSSAALAPGSLARLAAARSAALRGSPVGGAIRAAGIRTGGQGGATRRANQLSGEESRVWDELAACLDIAEASGCPLAELLTRFAAQLDAEDDADAARQTALAGPRATVRLLTWLPFLGLGLGMMLGVDPLGTLLGTPLGGTALAAGIALTLAGRLWSARLVRSAAGPPQ